MDEKIINLLLEANKLCNDNEYAAIVLTSDNIPVIGKFATDEDGSWPLIDIINDDLSNE